MKLYPKIDLYFAGDYLCSTEQARTCREARTAYLDRISQRAFYNGLVDARILKHPELLKARKAK